MSRRPPRTPVPGMLRGLVVGGGAALAVAALGGWVRSGSRGAASAIVVAALVVALLAGGVALVAWILAGPTSTYLVGAFVVYLGQLALLAMAVVTLRRTDWLDGSVAAAAGALAVVGAQLGLTVGHVRAGRGVFVEAGR
mgnify:FL=1